MFSSTESKNFDQPNPMTLDYGLGDRRDNVAITYNIWEFKIISFPKLSIIKLECGKESIKLSIE